MIYAGLGGGKAAEKVLHFLVRHLSAGDRTLAGDGCELGCSPTVGVFVLTPHCGAGVCPRVGHPGVGSAAQGQQMQKKPGKEISLQQSASLLEKGGS